MKDDSVVEIEGGPTCVHAAIELIAGHLRKFLVHRSIIGVFEMQVSLFDPGLVDWFLAPIWSEGSIVKYYPLSVKAHCQGLFV